MNHNATPNRQYKQLSDATKQKISFKMKGRSKSDSHKVAISKGMSEYWKTVPNRPYDNDNSQPANDK